MNSRNSNHDYDTLAAAGYITGAVETSAQKARGNDVVSASYTKLLDDAFTQVDKPRSWVYDDGGRAAAGYRGATGDCATRAIAIATRLPYQEVYDCINRIAARERIGKRKRSKSDARTGVYTPTVRRYLASIGWVWTPTMQIGSGCRVHLDADELPDGRLVVVVSRHYVAMIDGVIHDTHDPSRAGTRCVYGYFRLGAVTT